MLDFIREVIVQTAIMVAFLYLLNRWWPELERIPIHDGPWEIIRPTKTERYILLLVGIFGGAFAILLMFLCYRDYSIGRVQFDLFAIIQLGFGAVALLSVWIIFSSRARVKFDADRIEWCGAFFSGAARWRNVVKLTCHRLLGARIHLASGRIHTLIAVQAIDFNGLAAEAESRGIPTEAPKFLWLKRG